MSQVFEGYERQYCELSANLSRKCTSAGVLDGEQKKQKVAEIKTGLDDAEALIRKMDLKARSLPPNVKAMLLAKLREYETDLNNLKSEHKRITLPNSNQAARDDLLESGMSDTKMNLTEMSQRSNTRNRCRNGPQPENPQPLTFNDLLGALGRLTDKVEQLVTANWELKVNAAHQVHQPQPQNTLDDFLEMRPPEFYGTPDPDAAMLWKMRMEKIFEAMACTDEQRVRYAVYMLEGEAEHWWRTARIAHERDGTAITWEQFLRAFDRQYYSDSVRDRKEDEFNKLVQGRMTVAEYEAKFNSLSRFVEDIANNEGRKAQKFVMGLSTYIRDKLAVFRFESYATAVSHALNVEMNCTDLRQEQARDHKRSRQSERGCISGGRF